MIDGVEVTARPRRVPSKRRQAFALGSTQLVFAASGALALAAGAFIGGYAMGHADGVRSAVPEGRLATLPAGSEVVVTAAGASEPATAVPKAGPRRAVPSAAATSVAVVDRSAAPDRAAASDRLAPPKRAAPSTTAPAPTDGEAVQIVLSSDPPAGRFGVQIGAFASIADARRFVRRNAASIYGLPVFVVEAKIRGQTWYRVRVGAEQTRQQARVLKARLPTSLGAASMVTAYR